MTEKKLDSLDLSPIKASSSNPTTPMRPMRKLSRRNQGAGNFSLVLISAFYCSVCDKLE